MTVLEEGDSITQQMTEFNGTNTLLDFDSLYSIGNAEICVPPVQHSSNLLFFN